MVRSIAILLLACTPLAALAETGNEILERLDPNAYATVPFDADAQRSLDAYGRAFRATRDQSVFAPTYRRLGIRDDHWAPSRSGDRVGGRSVSDLRSEPRYACRDEGEVRSAVARSYPRAAPAVRDHLVELLMEADVRLARLHDGLAGADSNDALLDRAVERARFVQRLFGFEVATHVASVDRLPAVMASYAASMQDAPTGD